MVPPVSAARAEPAHRYVQRFSPWLADERRQDDIPVVDDKGSCPFRFLIFRDGRPWSATGGRIVTTLACEMARRNAQFGIASICAAGAMAGALILER